MRTLGKRRMPLLAAAAAIAATLTALLGLFAVPGSTAPAPPTGWTTVFSDDFSGAANTGLNTSNWLYDLGHSYPGGAGNWGTGEIESVTNSTSNVFQDGAGHLVIRPIRDGAGNWTSGRVETQRTDFAAPAGGQLQVTASVQQPNPGSGLGYWPAFWMLGAAARPVGATNWPSIGEVDIMEDVNALSQHSATLHCGTNPGGPCNETTGISSGLQGCGGCQTGYHTYSVIVDRTNTSAEQLRWYLDGNQFFTVNESQVGAATWQAAVDHGFFLILNLAIGGAYPNAICGCTSPSGATSSGAGMNVDYVAVYQTTGGGSTGSPTPTGGGGGGNAYSTLQAESFGSQSGVAVEACTDSGGGQDIGWLANGDWAAYPNIDFGSSPATQFSARVASGAAGGVSGLVQVRLDSPTAAVLGDFALASTGGWQTWRTVPANIAAVTGVHTVYLTFSSGQPADFVNVNWFTFGH